MHEKCMNMWHESLRASWGSPNPNLTALNNNNQSHTSKYAHIVIMQWGCNAWSYKIRFTYPNPEYSQKTQKPQNIAKAPKPRSNAWNAWERGRIWSSYHKIEALLGWKLDWSGDLSESEKFGLREKEICWERWENEKMKLHLNLK